MSDTKPKIHWMLDESLAHSKPSEWGRVISLEKKLVDLIASPKFEHVLPNPVDGLTKIFHDLKDQKFTTVMDLTGWLFPSLKDLFPNTATFEGFSLSRVRVISSPNLETSGYTVSMSPTEISNTKLGLNMEKTLIVDDTTFTGWTSLKTMELWRLDPKNTTHAFLIANTGMLNPEHGVKGAVKELQSHGSNVILGHELTTPQDDGWHLKDLHQHKNLVKAFELGLDILQLIDTEGHESENLKGMLKNEIVLNTIFPNRLSTNEINQMISEGKFIPSGKVDLKIDGLIHTKNPLLWASRYFMEHIDLQKVIDNKTEISQILGELHTLTEDPEAKSEAAIELRNIVRRETLSLEGTSQYGIETGVEIQSEINRVQLNNPGRQFAKGKERL